MNKYIQIMFVSSILLSACSEDQFPSELMGGDGHTIIASMPSGDLNSRIGITMTEDAGVLTWEEGDAFTGFSSIGTLPFTLVSVSENKKEATFKAPLDNVTPQLALFPRALDAKLDAKTLTVIMPAHYDKGTPSRNTPMLGKIIDNKVNFQHLAGVLRIDFKDLPDGYNTVKIIANSPVAGTYKVEDVDSESPVLVLDAVANNASNEIVVEHNGNDEPYYLPLPVGHYDEIHIYAVGEKRLQLYDVFNKTVERGTIYNVTRSFLLPATQEDFRLVRQNVLKANLRTPGQSEVDQLVSKFNKSDGSFNDINYAEPERGKPWYAQQHLENLHVLASAYMDVNNAKYYQSAELLGIIEKGLTYWVEQKPTYWNWWQHVVPEGRLLGLILLKMDAVDKKMNSDVVNAVVGLMKERCGHPFDQAGANRTDIATHWVYRAAATYDIEALSVAFEGAASAITYNSTDEGFQQDGGFFQHGKQLYIGGYGQECMKSITLVASLFGGTSFKLPAEKLDLLRTFLRDSFWGSTRGGSMSFSVMGRSVATRGGLQRAGMVQSLAERMKKIDPAHASEYDNIIANVSGSDPSVGVNSFNKQFYMSDYTLHVRPKYMFDVRMYSVNTCRVENGNDTNLKGYFLSDGSTCIMQHGDEYLDIMPVWNWSQIPGVTSPGSSRSIPSYPAWEVYGTSKFAGGVSDGMYGASAYSYQDNTQNVGTGANKSWFFFDDEVVCMGKTSSLKTKYMTTVNQCLKKSDIQVFDGTTVSSVSRQTNFDNPLWVLHDKIGYVFPQGGNVWVRGSSQRGNWFSINKNDSQPLLTKDVFGVGINHDNVTKNSYAYIVVPGVTSGSELAKYTTSESPIKIVSNTNEVQSVYHKDLNIWQTVFFRAGSTVTYNNLKLKADRKCVIMVKKVGNAYKVYVADPGRTRAVINIELTVGTDVKKVSAHMGTSLVRAAATQEFVVD